MLLTGHKSRAIFDRYNIINEQELLDAGDRRCCMKPLAGEVVWPALLLTLCSQWLQPPDGAR